MAKKKKRQKGDVLVQNAKAYAQQPKLYDIQALLLCLFLLLAGVGLFVNGIFNAQDGMKQDAEFVTIESAEGALLSAAGVATFGMEVLLCLVYPQLKIAHETVQRFNEIKQILIANADVLKGVDALKLDDIAPPPPPAEQKYLKRFSSRDLSWGWWLLVVGMFVSGILLMTAFFAMFSYPDFDSFVRQYVGRPKNLVLAGLLLMTGACFVMMMRVSKLAKLAARAEEAKTGIDAEDAPAECSGEQDGEDVRRSGSGGWWKDGDRSK